MREIRTAARSQLVLRLAPPEAQGVEALAREAGVHPELARRLVRMGLVDPPPPGSERWPPEAAARLARAVRLRRDLGLNYAGALIVSELLDRIDELERRLRRHEEV